MRSARADGLHDRKQVHLRSGGFQPSSQSSTLQAIGAVPPSDFEIIQTTDIP